MLKFFQIDYKNFLKELFTLPKIAYVQMEVVPGNPEVNAEKMLNFIEKAKSEKVELIVFPETALSGKFIGKTLQEKSFLRDCNYYGQKIVDASKDITIIFGNLIDTENKKINVSRYFIAYEGKIRLEGDCLAPVEMNFNGEDKEYQIAFQLDSAPFRLNEKIERDNFFAEQTKNLNRPLIYVNCIGIQNRGKTIYPFDGASVVYNSRGEIVQKAKSFSESLNIIELEEIDKMIALENEPEQEIAEIYQAISFGTEKFLQQIGMKKVVIGISGGIDSAVAAALYTKILGAENVLLVNMPSVFNSETTKSLSEQLAKNLGCKYAVVPIQESVDFTVKQLESTSIKFLSAKSEEQLKISSFVKENIQARDRSSRILAAVAAAVGGGFTCNANKAETSVGYATLYGDEAGFLCALADLWKFQIYQLADYLNDEVYKREVIPQGIIEIVPSAELSSAQNVDEGKGDPLKYPYHDFLFRAFIEKNLTPEDILQFYSEDNLESEIGCTAGLVKKYFSTAKDFIEDLEHWWKLFTGFAVAKRIQSPPIIAVTAHAYGSDFPEAQNIPYFTHAYKILKQKLLQQ